MSFVQKKCVTIIVESSIQSSVIKEIKTLGISGYSLSSCRGEGAHGLRIGDWSQNQNSVITIICSEELSIKIMPHIHDKFSENYALLIYASDVTVLRDKKF